MLLENLKQYEHVHYVDKETAELAKLAGFAEKTIFFYNWIGKVESDEDYDAFNRNIYDTLYSMPTLLCLRDWIERKYNIYIEIQLDRTTYAKYCFEIFERKPFNEWETIRLDNCEYFLYRTREECCEEAIKLILKQITK